MVRHRLDSVNEFARQGYHLKITCNRCGHSVGRDPTSVIVALHARHQSLQIEAIERRLRCGQCRSRGATVTATYPDDWPRHRSTHRAPPDPARRARPHATPSASFVRFMRARSASMHLAAGGVCGKGITSITGANQRRINPALLRFSRLCFRH